MKHFTLFVLSLIASSSLLQAGKTFEELDKTRLKNRFDRVIVEHKNYLIKHKTPQITFGYQEATLMQLVELKSNYNTARNISNLVGGNKQTEHYLFVKNKMYELGLLQPKKQSLQVPNINNSNHGISKQAVDNEDLDSQLSASEIKYFSLIQEAFNATLNNFVEPREAMPPKQVTQAIVPQAAVPVKLAAPAVATPPKVAVPQQPKPAPQQARPAPQQPKHAPKNAAAPKKASAPKKTVAPKAPKKATAPKKAGAHKAPKNATKKPGAKK